MQRGRASLAASALVTPRSLVACSGGADSLALAARRPVVARRRRAGHCRRRRRPWPAVRLGGRSPRAPEQLEAARGRRRWVVVSVATLRPAGRRRRPGTARYARSGRSRPRRVDGLLGHTLDDQAETVLLGLARGSGTRSLAGMARRAAPLLRPLLGYAGGDRGPATSSGMTPWPDPQNADPAYARSARPAPCCRCWRPNSVPGSPRRWPGPRGWPARRRRPPGSAGGRGLPGRGTGRSTVEGLADLPAALRRAGHPRLAAGERGSATWARPHVSGRRGAGRRLARAGRSRRSRPGRAPGSPAASRSPPELLRSFGLPAVRLRAGSPGCGQDQAARLPAGRSGAKKSTRRARATWASWSR